MNRAAHPMHLPPRPRAFDDPSGALPAHWILQWEEFDWAEKRWVRTFVLLAHERTGRELLQSFQGRPIRDLRLDRLIDAVPAGREMIQALVPPHLRFQEHPCGYRFAETQPARKSRAGASRTRLRVVSDQQDALKNPKST